MHRIARRKKLIRRRAVAPYVKPSWAKQTDWYKMVEDKVIYRNPRAKLHGLKHPARFIIDGQTGSGKTQLLLDIIRVMDCFDEIYVFTPFGDDDPLYKLLESQFEGKCMVTDDISELPDLKEISKEGQDKQRLFVFDDAVALPRGIQKRIMEYFIAVRKKNGSCAYLTQSYFDCPKPIRNQQSYVFLLPGLDEANENDFNAIASRLGNMEKIKNMYKDCNDEGEVFWIDCQGPKEKRFRCGFDRVITPK